MSKINKESKHLIIKIAEASQEVLIKAGIHPPYVNIDKSVFKKSVDDKIKLKIAKSLYKNTTLSI